MEKILGGFLKESSLPKCSAACRLISVFYLSISIYIYKTFMWILLEVTTFKGYLQRAMLIGSRPAFCYKIKRLVQSCSVSNSDHLWRRVAGGRGLECGSVCRQTVIILATSSSVTQGHNLSALQIIIIIISIITIHEHIRVPWVIINVGIILVVVIVFTVPRPGRSKVLRSLGHF